MVTNVFKDFALSFSGMDGGNIQSKIWFCGLEAGIGVGNQTTEECVEKATPVSLENIYSWEHENYKGSWEAQYNKKICWFLWYYKDLNWVKQSYQQFVEENHILYKDGLGFKLNMLPICFGKRENISHKWTSVLQEFTGFDTFYEYQDWCVEHRGAFFRKYIQQYKPKLIVCTGITERANFIRLFTGQSEFNELCYEQYKIAYAKFEDTLVCVVPFFGGSSGINSYSKMENLVKDIKLLANNNGISLYP